MDDSPPDFIIDNYELSELLTIFGIESPIKKEAIMKIAGEFIEKYKELGKSKYVEFFSKAKNKLLSDYELIAGVLGKAEGYIEKVEGYIEKVEESLNPSVEDAGPNMLKNQYYDGQSWQERLGTGVVLPNRAAYTSVPEKGMGAHAPQLQNRLLVPNAFAQIPFAQGYRNPTLQNAYITWLNIDSQYREILPSFVQINQRESSTDFTFSLATPITNVLAMTVGSIELSLAGYYAFSDIYGNTTFQVYNGTVNHCLRIPEGNYDASGIATVFNVALELAHPPISPEPKLVINKSNQKAYIYCPSGADCSNISFIWGNKNCCGSCDECCEFPYATASGNNTPIKYKCSDKNRGKKLNSTLGWALGFREHESKLKTVDILVNPVANSEILCAAGIPHLLCSAGRMLPTGHVSMIYGSSVCNLLGTKYFILEVDDFNRNRNNGEMATMTMPSTTNSFALPSYAKNVSQVYPICDSSNNNGQIFIKDTSGIEYFDRSCRKGPPPAPNGIKGEDTLTKAQKYTAREIRNTQKTTDVNQYFSPQASNILFRFPIQRLSTDLQVPIVIPNSAGLENGRKYFGPVTIEKLKVRLLDDKGYPADLHNGDISFSLILERLYQY